MARAVWLDEPTAADPCAGAGAGADRSQLAISIANRPSENLTMKTYTPHSPNLVIGDALRLRRERSHHL
jgi:hypothetical protein